MEGIEDGWLKIEEAKPAPGFQMPEDPITEVYVKGGENKTVTIPNTPLSALVVYKRDSVTGAGLSGCLFQLKYLGGEVSGSCGTVIGTYVTSQNGSFTVTGLKKGYYICEEMESDGAHVIDSAPQSFYISGEDQDIVTLYFSNAPLGQLIIHKLSSADHKTPLEGVQVKITYADGSYVDAEGGSQSSNGLYWTNSEGQIILSDVLGTVVATEVETIPGFTIHEETRSQTVTVNPGDTQHLYFYNDPIFRHEGERSVPVYRDGEHEFSYISRKDQQLRKVTVSDSLDALPPGYGMEQAEQHGELYVFGGEPPIPEKSPVRSKAVQRRGRER